MALITMAGAILGNVLGSAVGAWIEGRFRRAADVQQDDADTDS
ncbi:hypothetical protein OG728_39555 (plasmid) [Streptomyces microflavus]|nr:hypothetical protein OG728_38210 [Streptomyces microflavus]WSR96570.1 hypothetical protein OG728_39555 [Streptomyces microflavus]